MTQNQQPFINVKPIELKLTDNFKRNKPTLTQVSWIADALTKNDNIAGYFEVDDDMVFNLLWPNEEPAITYKQYQLLCALLFNKHYLKLNQVLIDLGLKAKAETRDQNNELATQN